MKKPKSLEQLKQAGYLFDPIGVSDKSLITRGALEEILQKRIDVAKQFGHKNVKALEDGLNHLKITQIPTISIIKGHDKRGRRVLGYVNPVTNSAFLLLPAVPAATAPETHPLGDKEEAAALNVDLHTLHK